MSLLDGARQLANGAGQICTPLHIFLAALPPYAQNYFGEPPRSYWENRVPAHIRQRWASEALPKLAPFTVGQQGLPPNGEFLAIEQEASTRAVQMQKTVDAVALALAIEHPAVKEIIARIEALMPAGMNPDALARELDDRSQPSFATSGVRSVTGPPPVGLPVVQSAADKDLDLARKTVAEFYTQVEPSSDDLAYRTLQTVDTNTFLTTLAQSSRNSITTVCIGRPGSLINLVEYILAARLASGDAFKGQQDDLNEFKGGLYKIDVSSLINRTGRPETAKAATVIKALKEKLSAMSDKPILMYDHLEALQSGRSDVEDVRFEVAEHGRLLAFGIYHVPDDRDHMVDARLGHNNIRLIPFDPFTPEGAKTLIADFFIKLWTNPRRNQNEGRTFIFDRNAWDEVIALEGGAWHDLKRKVLPGLAIDITENALQTVINGEESLRQTVNCALEAFKALRNDEMPHTAYRRKYEPTLKRAEEIVKQLQSSLQQKGGFLRFGTRTGPLLDPGKPIRITSAHLIAELVCPNVSEYHYPEFVPEAVRELMAQQEPRK